MTKRTKRGKEKKIEIVINRCFGGFSISKEAAEFMAKRGNKEAQKELDEWKKSNDKIQYYLKNGKWPEGCEEDEIGFLEIDAEYLKEARWYGYVFDREKRDNPDLVAAVKKLGKRANGDHTNLKIVRIPAGVEWEIEEYDGNEWVSEKHRVWS